MDARAPPRLLGGLPRQIPLLSPGATVTRGVLCLLRIRILRLVIRPCQSRTPSSPRCRPKLLDMRQYQHIIPRLQRRRLSVQLRSHTQRQKSHILLQPAMSHAARRQTVIRHIPCQMALIRSATTLSGIRALHRERHKKRLSR